MKTMETLLIINNCTEDTEAPKKKIGRPKGSKDTLKRARRGTLIELPESSLTALHYAVLELLYTYRVLTTDQLLTLIFLTGLVKPGSKTYVLEIIKL